MLHLLLVTLTGLKTDLFVDFPTYNNPTAWIINPAFPYLHISERKSLNQLAKLGFTKAQLDLFISSSSSSSSASFDGQYLTATKCGIQLVLDQYLKLIDTLETQSIKSFDDDYLPVSVTSLLAYFADSFLILESVYDFVISLNANKNIYFGSKLLDLIVPKSLFDARPCIQQAFQLIARPVLYLFFSHISQCLLYSNYVFDPYNEFFIQTSNTDDGPTFLSFNIIPDLIPSSLISNHLANQILFTVTSSYIVQQSPNYTELITPDSWQNHLSILTKLLDSNQSDLRSLDLELAIHLISIDYNRALWKIMILDVKLIDYLKAIGLIYLGNNGDFMRQFMIQIVHLESKSKSEHMTLGVSTRALNIQFQATYAQVVARTFADALIPASSLIDQFAYAQVQDPLPATQHRFTPFHTSIANDQDIQLQFHIPWPISLIITKDQLSVYNYIHQALLHIHRVHTRLNQLNVLVRCTLHPRRNVVPAVGVAGTYLTQLAATLQTEVAHTVRAILESIVAVIDAAFRSLMYDLYNDQLAESETSIGIMAGWERRHCRFIDEIAQAVFLDNNDLNTPSLATAIAKSLTKILDLADHFAVAVEKGVSEQTIRAWIHEPPRSFDSVVDSNSYKHRQGHDGLGHMSTRLKFPDSFDMTHVIQSVRSAADRFSQEAKFFYRMLTSAQSDGTFIVQELLVRLDFNKHWSLGPLRLSGGRSIDQGIQPVPNEIDGVSYSNQPSIGVGRARRWETLQDTWLSGTNVAQEPHLPTI